MLRLLAGIRVKSSELEEKRGKEITKGGAEGAAWRGKKKKKGRAARRDARGESEERVARVLFTISRAEGKRKHFSLGREGGEREKAETCRTSSEGLHNAYHFRILSSLQKEKEAFPICDSGKREEGREPGSASL